MVLKYSEKLLLVHTREMKYHLLSAMAVFLMYVLESSCGNVLQNSDKRRPGLLSHIYLRTCTVEQVQVLWHAHSFRAAYRLHSLMGLHAGQPLPLLHLGAGDRADPVVPNRSGLSRGDAAGPSRGCSRRNNGAAKASGIGSQPPACL